MNFTFRAVSKPECETFLKIKKGETYYSIEDFTTTFHSDSVEVLNDCTVWYRGTEKSHQQTIEIDIDAELPKLRRAHIAILQCLGEIITAVDFNGHSVQLVNKEATSNE